MDGVRQEQGKEAALFEKSAQKLFLNLGLGWWGFQDFISPIFQNGAEETRRLYLLHDSRLAAGLTTLTLGAFCAEQIAAMETGEFRRFRALVNLLTFLESVGLQTRRGYLSRDDIFFMLKGPLEICTAILLDYLEENAAGREGAWAQAIWLLKTIPDYRPETRLRD